MHLKVLAVAVVALLGSLGLAQAQDEPDIDVKDAVIEKFGEDAVMSCKPNGVDSFDPIKWTKKDTVIVETEGKYKIHNNNGTLTVMEVMPDDVGEYVCELTLGNENSYNRTVNLFSAAYVHAFDKSKNLVQGDPLVLECEVNGHPIPTVTWYKDDVILNDSEERVKFKVYKDVENATLRIENLDFDDRADYVCYAENQYGFHNSTILVRVKDKLAALWPFLGICAEVAILVVIIFIYERKRAKKLEEMEAKEEADHLTNSHTHKGGDDVRQRK